MRFKSNEIYRKPWKKTSKYHLNVIQVPYTSQDSIFQSFATIPYYVAHARTH